MDTKKISSIRQSYENIFNEARLKSLLDHASELQGLRILEINTSDSGGGVAAMLHAKKRLMHILGLSWDWEIIEGDESFNRAIKDTFNALQAGNSAISEDSIRLIEERCEKFINEIELDCYKIIIIHDNVFPLANIIKKMNRADRKAASVKRIVWRSHMDTSSMNEECWNSIKSWMSGFDHFVCSRESYLKREWLDSELSIVKPAIDPLDKYNRLIPEKKHIEVLTRIFNGEISPYILMISRFDKWKGHNELIEAFKQMKSSVSLMESYKLVLVGESSADDPEGRSLLRKIRCQAAGHNDIIILISSDEQKEYDMGLISYDEQNILQAKADIVVHVPYAAGFELSVTSSLYKARPLVASNAGGLADQVIEEQDISSGTGLMIEKGELDSPNHETIKELINAIMRLLDQPEAAALMGENASRHIAKNYLVDSNIMKWLKIFQTLQCCLH